MERVARKLEHALEPGTFIIEERGCRMIWLGVLIWLTWHPIGKSRNKTRIDGQEGKSYLSGIVLVGWPWPLG